MKVAISSTGSNLESQTDPRFGRAAYFIIYDDATNEVIQVIDNTESVNVAHGAGINAATTIANAGVKTLITGQVGPKAQAVLEQAGINVFSFAGGTVKAAMEAMKNGLITPSQTEPGFGSTGPGFGRGMGGGRGMGCGRGMGGSGGMGGGRGMGGRGMGGRQGRGYGCRRGGVRIIGQGFGKGRGM